MAIRKDAPEGGNWLRRLQEGSWEPEILISGIVLYGLFQIPPLVDQLNFYLEHYGGMIFSRGSVNDNVAMLLHISTAWLIFGFISHLLFRSVWAAFVGLSYVYQDGPRPDKLKYPARFQNRLNRQRDFKPQIIKLEKVCSTLFSLSFLLFMNIVGLVFCFLVISSLIALWLHFFPEATDFSLLNIILTSVLGLYLVDYITLGLPKRIPYFNRLYYPVYRVLSLLTLAPLYRSIYYTLVSHHQRWKVILGIVLFVGISSLVALNANSPLELGNNLSLRPFSRDKVIMFHGHYRDLAGEDYSIEISLPSRQVDGPVLEAFVVHRTRYEEQEIMPACGYEALKDDPHISQDSLKMSCLRQFYNLGIDGEMVEAKQYYHQHQTTQQDGLLSYVDISNLSRGLHTLELYYQDYDKEQDTSVAVRQAQVEFYKTQAPLSSPVDAFD
jgi:hypothetical protein